MTITQALLPNGRQQFLNSNGSPVAGGSVGMYIPGTLTPKPTYIDPNGDALNLNPVPLDAGGTALIYGSGQFRQIVLDAQGNTIWDALTYGLTAADAPAGGYGPQTQLASAATTDLGIVSSHNVLVTGNAAIGSLGNSASLTNPIYYVEFDSSLTISNSNVSLQLPGAADITVLSGDAMLIEFLGAGNWKVSAYWPKSGAIAALAQILLASAATVQLGMAKSHNVKITGVVTIASFGNQASLSLPIYFVEFDSALTLTNSISLVCLGGKDTLTVAGDCAQFEYLGGGAWKMISYSRYASQPGTLIRTTILAGSGNYTPDSKASTMDVEVCSGGGGGSGTSIGGSGNVNAGSGGGPGGYTRGTLPAAITAYVVGTGGAGGVGANGGTVGNGSSFGALAISGGAGGAQGVGSTSGDKVLVSAPSPGGTVTGPGNIISAHGAAGFSGIFSGAEFSLGGNGGTGPWGGGGIGGYVNSATTMNGGSASAPGAGGGGAAATSGGGTVTANGGAGGDGIIIVRDYT